MEAINYDGARICNVPDNLGDVGCRWPMLGVTLFASGRIGDVDLADAAIIAIRNWNAVCGIRLVMTVNSKTAHIIWSVGQIDGSGGVLAQHELPCGFTGPGNLRVLRGTFDIAERAVLADNPPIGTIDIGRVGTHELGHGLGIGHISDGNLMAPVYSSTISVPRNGDIVEARARYSAPAQPPMPPTTPPPPPGSPIGPSITDVDGVRWKWVGWERL